MEAVFATETVVTICETAECHTPEDNSSEHQVPLCFPIRPSITLNPAVAVYTVLYARRSHNLPRGGIQGEAVK
jgi:hypothetical protein